jgi:hypothetical protein
MITRMITPPRTAGGVIFYIDLSPQVGPGELAARDQRQMI